MERRAVLPVLRPLRRVAEVAGVSRLEVAAQDLPLPARLALGAGVGLAAVLVAVLFDLSLAWALLPPIAATVLTVEFIGVRASIVASAVAVVGTAWFAFPPNGLAVESTFDQTRLAVYLIAAAFIIAMGGRLRQVSKLLTKAYAVQSRQQAELEATWAKLDALTDTAPIGMCLIDRDLTFVKVNPELARINGMTVAEHIGRSVTAVHGLDAFAVASLEAILAGGPEVRERELSTVDQTDPTRTTHVLASWFPVRDSAGDMIAVGALVQDITRRKVAEERLWLLAELSDLLEEPLDLVSRSEALAHLVVPRLADLCLVLTRPTDHAPLRLHAVACSDPARGVLAADLVEKYPELVEDSDILREVLSGETVVMNDDPLQDATAAELGGLRALNVSSLLCIPLAASGRQHGAVMLAKFSPTPGFDPGEVTYAGTLVARAAVALDNAYLYDQMATLADREHDRAELLSGMEAQQRYIADTLQRSLLPDALPELPSVALASAFRPAGLGLEVGGDTFDVFDVGDVWIAFVADVCGKGPRAAARTGLVRYTVRAEARHDPDPANLLRQVNSAVLRQSPDDSSSFVTMVVVSMRRCADGDLDVVVASGGHPPALLVRAGICEEVTAHGTIVGAFPDASFASSEARMRPGDTLLLYTDGVTESRGQAGDLYGEDRLIGSLAAAHARGTVHAQGLVDAIVLDIDAFAGDRRQDDLAILAVQVLPVQTQLTSDVGLTRFDSLRAEGTGA